MRATYGEGEGWERGISVVFCLRRRGEWDQGSGACGLWPVKIGSRRSGLRDFGPKTVRLHGHPVRKEHRTAETHHRITESKIGPLVSASPCWSGSLELVLNEITLELVCRVVCRCGSLCLGIGAGSRC